MPNLTELIQRLESFKSVAELKETLKLCDNFLLKYSNLPEQEIQELYLKIIDVLRKSVKINKLSKPVQLGEMLIKDSFDKSQLLSPSLLIYDYDCIRESLGHDSWEGYKRLRFGQIGVAGSTDPTQKSVTIDINHIKEKLEGSSVNDVNLRILFVIRHELAHVKQYNIQPETDNAEEQLILNDMAMREKSDLSYLHVHDSLMMEFYADAIGKQGTYRDCTDKYRISKKVMSTFLRKTIEWFQERYSNEISPREKIKNFTLNTCSYHTESELEQSLAPIEDAIRMYAETSTVKPSGDLYLEVKGFYNPILIRPEEYAQVAEGRKLTELYGTYNYNR